MNIEPNTNRSFLILLGELIDEKCKQGESVEAIAIRAGVSRDLVSRIRNRNYRSAPSLSNVEAVCHAIGHRLALEPILDGVATQEKRMLN